MNNARQVIVDGYNVIRRNPDLSALFHKDMPRARAALAVRCVGWRSARRDIADVLIVYDGAAAAAGAPSAAGSGVRTVFTRRGETADQCIAALLLQSAAPRRLLVVSDDAEVARQARACGAEVLGVSGFLDAPRARRRRPASAARDDKLRPHEQGEINAWLRDKLGLE